MDKFWELLDGSVIIRGALALSSFGVILYLAVIGREIPPLLATITTAILSFFFGVEAVRQAYKGMLKRLEEGK